MEAEQPVDDNYLIRKPIRRHVTIHGIHSLCRLFLATQPQEFTHTHTYTIGMHYSPAYRTLYITSHMRTRTVYLLELCGCAWMGEYVCEFETCFSAVHVRNLKPFGIYAHSREHAPSLIPRAQHTGRLCTSALLCKHVCIRLSGVRVCECTCGRSFTVFSKHKIR